MPGCRQIPVSERERVLYYKREIPVYTATRSGTCLLLPSTPPYTLLPHIYRPHPAIQYNTIYSYYIYQDRYNITCVCVYKYVCMYQVQLAFRYAQLCVYLGLGGGPVVYVVCIYWKISIAFPPSEQIQFRLLV